jgi:ADP-ribose pyrophosphatase YjhB (NUDIX family)
MDLPIKVEGIIFAKEDAFHKFLLIKRVPEEGGFWQPLTESLREKETVEECLLRGLREELGIKEVVNITDRIWQFGWDKNGETNLDLVYGVEILSDTKIILSKEHSRYRWCSFNIAVSLLKYDTNKEALKRFRTNFMKKTNTSKTRQFN